MRFLKYLLVGVLFGVVMTKAEIISWYRIYEMFRFESFHMYGIIGSAVVLGIIMIQLIRRNNVKDLHGDSIKLKQKDKFYKANIIGGTLFGVGWGMVGACPGPMFVLLGHGFISVGIVILGAILGTFTYGILRSRLPH